MSVADAALRNETTPETVFGMPVGVVAYTLRAAGTTRFGGVLSETVTLNDAWAVLECESVALQLTAVVPSGNFVPEAGAHGTIATGPSTASIAVGVG